MVRLFIISIFFICSVAKGQQIPPAIAKRLLTLPDTYVGKLPCADCAGIETTLTLQCDSLCDHGRYMRVDKYVNTKNGDQLNKTKGYWGYLNKATTTEHGSFFIALNVGDTTKMSFYEVTKKGDLLPVDKDLKKIDAPIDMTLKKL